MKEENFTVQCSWCGKIMRKGIEKISHSICLECMKINFADVAERLKEKKEKLA